MSQAGVPGAGPKHVAIIMDGNNRWAKREGLVGAAGHRAGVEIVREILRACESRGIEVLTLFAFSSENWGRPQVEVRALLTLLTTYLRREVTKLKEDGIRLRFIGRRDRFSAGIQRLMERSEAATATCTKATLVLAVDYGGRWDIANAAKTLAERVQRGEIAPSDIDEHALHQQTALSDLPPPDLCIRTGGDARVSNFLLWQFAYAEFYFVSALWPDFNVTELDAAIEDFAGRERRFGLRPDIKE